MAIVCPYETNYGRFVDDPVRHGESRDSPCCYHPAVPEEVALVVDILRQKSNHILALIGRGSPGSLGFFKRVQMADPRGPEDVRVGIAHCFWRMGDLDNARRFFEMALEHNRRSRNVFP
ncbi:RNA polymerase-associated protein CTR9 homolog [Drosophila suzukii]|uniref:RNA polymerase-associated protein CTR9 homolog n=1 Tax=Drosophila suzukii TaxID=28584 RepID=A0ABM4TW71_DROSZ